MVVNPFDKAVRYAAKLDPPAFLSWALGLPSDAFAFGGWLDTRAVPLPKEPDQIGDTVARLSNPRAAEPDWAVAVEFQTEPDALMFGRLLVYLGHLWQAVKPDPERGSRYQVGAVVLNLTGTGNASRDMRWPGTRLVTHFGVAERNLASERADELLAGLEGGRWSRALLPWLPLMTGGGDPGIIDRWKALAAGEPDRRTRGDYAILAETLAEAAGREAIWKKALEGWNVTESKVLNRLLAEHLARETEKAAAEGEARGRAAGEVQRAVVALVAVLEARFGRLPADLEAAVRGSADLAKLHTWTTQAATAPDLAAFRAAAGL